MKRLGASRARRGFTIIEAIVAAVILGVGLMSLMNVWLFSFEVTRRSDEVAVAYNMARNAVEGIRSNGYYFAAENGAQGAYDVAGNQAGAPGYNGTPYFNMAVNITNGSDESAATQYLDLRQVDVIVTRVSDGQIVARTSSLLTVGGI